MIINTHFLKCLKLKQIFLREQGYKISHISNDIFFGCIKLAFPTDDQF